jgi:hypothetical protein
MKCIILRNPSNIYRSQVTTLLVQVGFGIIMYCYKKLYMQ